MRAWPRLRRITQIGAFLGFLALLLLTRGAQFPDVPSSLFFRLDPLGLLAASVAGREWIGGLALGLVTLGVTLAAGRVWCGWICPLGTVLDWCRFSRGGVAAMPALQGRDWRDVPSWRGVKYLLLLAVLGAAVGGNLTLLAFDPIAILTRGLTSFLLPGLNLALLGVEGVLVDLPVAAEAVDVIDGVRTSLFSANVWNWWNVLPGLLLLAVVGLNLAGERFWCRYLCPLGALLGLLSRLAFLRRVVRTEACIDCGRCVPVCPTGTVDAASFRSDPAECTVCLDCLPACPVPGAQTFAAEWGPAAAQEYDPGRRQTVVALGAGLLGALVYPLAPRRLRRRPDLVRPPGAQDERFLSLCIRCSQCMKVCPTSGLQPAVWESGLDGFWTPTLVSRLGYCDYSCNACGQVCPTGAIPNLSLEEKRKTVIGIVVIDEHRCWPWNDNIPCIVCEEMCPVSPKAISLEAVEVTDADGQPLTLQRPHVVDERCIGCGICEYKCPVPGVAAIHVISPS